MNNFENILKESGGLFEGHTVFKNGFHGNGWFEKGFIIRKPKLLDLIAKYEAEIIIGNFPTADLIVGPIISGSLIASFVARHLDKELAVTVGKGKDIEFHRMNIPTAPRKVVLIEDLVFTGTDIKANTEFLVSKGFEVLGAVVWINRLKDEIDNIKVISLMSNPPFELYEPSQCPLCTANIPVKYNTVRE